ncbi:CASP-like protein 1E2 [Elaeis guineensis]|uniref:CASP-like protein n=1 Tax=Elaeis guineensis var. tenera TaxID=51953 RepID=A0A8N4I9V8_ELAGV|nr:CASP-like protein 1E2 [Elaeis guineensis]
MESRVKPGLNGTQGARSQVKDDEAGMPGLVRIGNMILRLVALATTLVAAIVIGTAKQVKTVNIQVAPTLPPLPVSAVAKTSYASAFVYFLIANVIACVYAAISLGTSTMKRASKSKLRLSLSIIDIAMVALLFSGNGAALTFGLLGKYGNSHVKWQKVCNVFDKFCLHVAVSSIASLLGALAYVLLVLLAIVSLHKRSP